MDTAVQFCVGSLLIVILGLGGLCAYLAKLLSDANARLALTSETSLLASKAADPRALAEALNQRDAARHDNATLQKELKNSIPVARNLHPELEDDRVSNGTLYIGGLALDPIKR